MILVDGGYSSEQVKPAPKPEPPPPPKPAETVTDRDGADSLRGLFSLSAAVSKLRAVPLTTPKPPAASVTPDEQKQIDDGTEKVFQTMGNGDGNATVELANQLRGKSDNYQAQFFKTLYEHTNAGLTGNLLRTAGGEMPHYISDARPSDDDKAVIATAFGKAYDQGAIGKEFVDNMLKFESIRLPPGNDYSGNLVAQSGSSKLIKDYSEIAFGLYNNGSNETATFNSGATKALSGDPQLLQTKLSELGRDGKLEDFLKNLTPSRFNVPYYEEGDNALANIITTAARIQPPTAEVLGLFKYVANNQMDQQGIPEAMTQLYTGGNTEFLRFPNGKVDGTIFHSNAEFFLHSLTAVGDGHDPLAATALTKFYERTIFDDKFADRTLVADVTAREIQKIQDAVKNYPQVDSRTKQLIDATTAANPTSSENHDYQIKEQLAFRLGRATGAVFQGFERAVSGRNADNAKADAAVDFLFEVVPIDEAKSAAGKVPGVGYVANLSAGKAIDAGKGALKDWLHQHDLNDDREDVYNTFMNVANTISSDLYDEHSGGREDIAGISRDLTNK